jgi:ribose 5-phosphate isomerase B
MSIAANKVKGIRAALCCDNFMAERARLHNNANILCLGAEKTRDVSVILDSFFSSEFEGGRHQKRLDKIADIENG